MPTQVFEPTIHQVSADERGEIYAISLPGDRELLLLHSKKGTYRGGHSHDVDEQVLFLTGKMRYYKRSVSGEERVEDVEGGVSSFNPAHEVHMGEFLEDTWLLEWKIGTNKWQWTNRNYAPWRERVDAASR